MKNYVVIITVLYFLFVGAIYNLDKFNSTVPPNIELLQIKIQYTKQADSVFKIENKQEKIELQTKNISLGEFKVTAYCACKKCCGKSKKSKLYGITSTGTKATQGRTIAVDYSVIPKGSTVIIDGNEYTAEDCGGGINGNRIDVYFESHKEALSFGVQYHEVFIKN